VAARVGKYKFGIPENARERIIQFMPQDFSEGIAVAGVAGNRRFKF